VLREAETGIEQQSVEVSIDFFINEFLLYEDAKGAAEGSGEVDAFLGDWACVGWAAQEGLEKRGERWFQFPSKLRWRQVMAGRVWPVPVGRRNPEWLTWNGAGPTETAKPPDNAKSGSVGLPTPSNAGMKPALLIVCLLAAFLACVTPSVPAPVSDPATPLAKEPTVVGPLTRTNAVPPGIYESAPFTCIVLVPDHHMDPHFVVPPRMPPSASAMPVIQPEMRLIPRSRSR
jgi:hypothetical protein